MHFLHTDPTHGSYVLESIKNPLENRIWFLTPGQTVQNGSPTVGSSNKPIVVARVLDDGTPQLTMLQRNDFGHITQITDPKGRQFTFQYGNNNEIDLTAVIATTGTTNSTLFSATYSGCNNGPHQPCTITDAAGEKSQVTYNGRAQLKTFTNALNQTINFVYDEATRRPRNAPWDPFFLSAIQVMSPDSHIPVNQVAFDLGSYGLIGSVTDATGYTKTITYDVYSRPTKVLFPDGTAETWSYKLSTPQSLLFRETLDLQAFTDRMNRTTTYSYDFDRRLTSITDPLSHTTQFSYCGCGTISTITDPNGNVTKFTYDADDRLTTRQYADGSQTIYTYENTTRRLKSVTDKGGRGSSYAYNVDDTLCAVGNPASGGSLNCGGSGSPTVQFLYDPVFRRLTNMTDQFGTTTYSYYPVASGSPVKQTESNQYGDTISYTYDELGRLSSRTVDAVTTSQTYDAIGRLSEVRNPLGTFTYSYVGTSNRVAKVASCCGPEEDITYPDVGSTEFKTTGDYLPQKISWLGPPPASAPPSAACTADIKELGTLLTQVQTDQSWLNRWCYRSSASSGQNGVGKITGGGQSGVIQIGGGDQGGCDSVVRENCQKMAAESVNSECQQLGAGYCFEASCAQSQISGAIAQRTKDCAPPPQPHSVLASFNYSYNADGEVNQISFGGNMINFPTGTGTPSSTGTYAVAYYGDGKLQSITPVGTQQGGARFAYIYDPASNLIQMQSGGSTTSFTPNNLNQIATPGGNYDGDGNLNTIGQGQTLYGWGFAAEEGSVPLTLNQPDALLNFIQYNPGALNQSTTQFKYDGFGRRTEIIERNNGAVTSHKRNRSPPPCQVGSMGAGSMEVWTPLRAFATASVMSAHGSSFRRRHVSTTLRMAA